MNEYQVPPAGSYGGQQQGFYGSQNAGYNAYQQAPAQNTPYPAQGAPYPPQNAQQGYQAPPQAAQTMAAPDGFDWDSEIEYDGEPYTLLPPGLYNFTVQYFDKGLFPGSAKIPPCPKAVLHLSVSGPAGSGSLTDDIIIAKPMEWKISQFFRGIGQKKHGEKLKPDWSKVPGSVGVLELETRTWKGRDGQDRQSNSVKRYIDFDPNNIMVPDGQGGDVPFN